MLERYVVVIDIWGDLIHRISSDFTAIAAAYRRNCSCLLFLVENANVQETFKTTIDPQQQCIDHSINLSHCSTMTITLTSSTQLPKFLFFDPVAALDPTIMKLTTALIVFPSFIVSVNAVAEWLINDTLAKELALEASRHPPRPPMPHTLRPTHGDNTNLTRSWNWPTWMRREWF